MNRFSALLILSLATLVAVWQLCVTHPILPRLVSCGILALSGILAGLRIGTDCSMQLIEDLERKNRYLADENRDLADLNLRYMQKHSEHGRESEV